MPTPDATNSTRRSSCFPLLLIGAAVVLIILAILAPRQRGPSTSGAGSTNSAPGLGEHGSSLAGGHKLHEAAFAGPSASPQEVVAAKLNQFSRGRRAITQAMAKKFKVTVPPEVEQFYAAAEAGRWDEMKTLFQALRDRRDHPGGEDLKTLWGPIMETYGVAEEARRWPADKLLSYGQTVLDSLKPGMVYVGGTDPGRFIPTLLNDTSDGEHHVILTQNALADGTYVQYLNFLHGDQMPLLSGDDSQRAFSDYLADAQKRLAHDQQFPDETKQVLPGEDIRVTDGKVQVSGQVAVMEINEKLLQMILDKNPDTSFAMEESFRFPSINSNAIPLGPIFELRGQDAQGAAVSDRTAQALDYWNATAQQLLAEPDIPADSAVRQTYAKMAASQAGLLATHNSTAEAEQLFSLATQLCPFSPEAVFRYVNLLVGEKRFADAQAVAQGAVNAATDKSPFQGLLDNVRRLR